MEYRSGVATATTSSFGKPLLGVAPSLLLVDHDFLPAPLPSAVGRLGNGRRGLFTAGRAVLCHQREQHVVDGGIWLGHGEFATLAERRECLGHNAVAGIEEGLAVLRPRLDAGRQ